MLHQIQFQRKKILKIFSEKDYISLISFFKLLIRPTFFRGRNLLSRQPMACHNLIQKIYSQIEIKLIVLQVRKRNKIILKNRDAKEEIIELFLQDTDEQ